MSNSAEVAVVGLGVMGAAVCHELARRGARVIGLDPQPPGHTLGSSHGRTRIIREAYFEHPLYVPLVQRALELWLEIEDLTGAVLYRQTGGLTAGSADSIFVQGALASAREHHIEHELLDAAEIRLRFPALQPQPHHVGVLEHRAGILMSDSCVRTLHMLAAGYGARMLTHAGVTAWRRAADRIILRTTQGEVEAERVVFAAGAWLNHVLAAEESSDDHLQLPLTVERQTPHWFLRQHGGTRFRAERCPVTLLQHDSGTMLYTLPDIGHGVKAGIHHEGRISTADAVDRTITLHDERRLRALVEEWLPGSTETVVDASVCLYTNTPDGHFLVDEDWRDARVTVVSACSGHGFKFATALGETVADRVLEGASAFDLTPFRAARFTSQSAAPPTDTAHRTAPS